MLGEVKPDEFLNNPIFARRVPEEGTNIDIVEALELYTSYQINSAETRDLIDCSNALFNNDIENPALAAISVIKLHLFNLLKRTPSISDLHYDREIGRMQRMSDQEKEYREQFPDLPTVGLEVEADRSILTPETTAIMRHLGVEDGYEMPPLWELRSVISRNPHIQARFLEEIGRFGLIRPDEKDLPTLHLNYGLPADFSDQDLSNYRSSVATLNKALSIAFSSPSRLRDKKYGNEYSLGKMGKNEKGSYVPRLELRSYDFKGPADLRMIIESQRAVAALISSIKQEKGVVLTAKQEGLAGLWLDSEKRIFQKMSEITGEDNASKQLSDLPSDVFDNQLLRSTCRRLVWQLSGQAQSILKG